MTHSANHLISQLASQIQDFIQDHPDALLVGIHTGGVWIANAINAELDTPLPMGTLNISFYRDDFTRIGLHPNVSASELPFELDDRPVILVDDVIYTGRTARAALNELFDFGRPSKILLAVLIEREGQELPIKASFIGHQLKLNENEHVQVMPDPIRYEVKQHKEPA